jgi:hypothetical protein
MERGKMLPLAPQPPSNCITFISENCPRRIAEPSVDFRNEVSSEFRSVALHWILQGPAILF